MRIYSSALGKDGIAESEMYYFGSPVSINWIDMPVYNGLAEVEEAVEKMLTEREGGLWAVPFYAPLESYEVIFQQAYSRVRMLTEQLENARTHPSRGTPSISVLKKELSSAVKQYKSVLAEGCETMYAVFAILA